MRVQPRLVLIAATVAVGLAASLTAQSQASLSGDLASDIDEVQSKIVGLAKAMPPEAFAWRPSDGIRSSAEVFRHVASDNYFMPGAMGATVPADTGIDVKDYKTVVAYEKRGGSRDEVVADLDKSFAFLKAALKATPDDKMSGEISAFGQTMTARKMWVSTVTHLHEHLGQLIAYARTNKVTPPWSK